MFLSSSTLPELQRLNAWKERKRIIDPKERGSTRKFIKGNTVDTVLLVHFALLRVFGVVHKPILDYAPQLFPIRA